MAAWRLLQKICGLVVSACKSTIDYLSYAVEEFRNSERNRAWIDEEMHALQTAQQDTREEIATARERREFWTRLIAEGEKESNGIHAD